MGSDWVQWGPMGSGGVSSHTDTTMFCLQRKERFSWCCDLPCASSPSVFSSERHSLAVSSWRSPSQLSSVIDSFPVIVFMLGVSCSADPLSSINKLRWAVRSFLDWVSSHLAHITVHGFACVYFVYIFVILHMLIVTLWGGPDGIESQSLGPYLPSVLWHCWLG